MSTKRTFRVPLDGPVESLPLLVCFRRQPLSRPQRCPRSRGFPCWSNFPRSLLRRRARSVETSIPAIELAALEFVLLKEDFEIYNTYAGQTCGLVDRNGDPRFAGTL